MNKEPFKFSYNIPSLDWYTTKDVEINWDDYSYFKLEYRYGDSYWLIGYRCIDNNGNRNYDELGNINKNDIGKFIKWCEFPFGNGNGNKLVEISAISTGMNIAEIIREISSLIKKD